MTIRQGPLWALLASFLSAQSALAEDFVSPNVLVLGDSQIPFGSGPAFLDFFNDIAASCEATPEQAIELEKLGEPRTAIIGVRSTSLPTWLTTSRRGKSALCDVDPDWRVNAGSYGYINETGNKYVQIGRGEAYQFCAPGQSAFQTMFRDDYYTPKLTLMTFLGNSSRRWADSLDAAIDDVRRLEEQLPADMGCIFMTTQPAYKENIVEMRLQAQEHLEIAFDLTDSRCSFVPGATDETIAANLGNAQHFRRRNNGSVKDPYHPNEAAARNFFELERDAICAAVLEQVEPLMPMEQMTAQIGPEDAVAQSQTASR